MENFIVSARKYRPKTFDSVIGQESITLTLKNAIINDQLAQAFLFCGPRGVGKTTCARILAKTINCTNISEDTEACGKCDSCLSFERSTSFNIHELDAASNNSVDDIRNLVTQVSIPPQAGKYKIYIIDEVHMLSSNAFNAFLKTLEEPPHYAKFILATTEKHKIIPTVLSRCQIYDFKRIRIPEIVKHLEFIADEQGVNAADEALHIIAQKADGALRDALSVFDQLVNFSGKDLSYQKVIENLNVLDYDYYFKMTDFILKNDIASALQTLNEIFQNGFDGQHFISGLCDHFRSLMVSRSVKTIDLIEISEELKKRYLQQSGKCSTDFLLQALKVANDFDITYRTSSHKSLHIEIAVMHICNINNEGISEQRVEKVQEVAKLPTIEKKEVRKEIKIEKKQEDKPVEHKIYEQKEPEKKSNKSEEIPQKFEKKSPIKKTEPIKERPKTKYAGSGFSLKQNFASLKKETDELDELKVDKDDEFDQIILEKAWQDLGKVFEKSNPKLFITLQANKPLIKKYYTVEFPISNSLQEKEIAKNKIEILNFMRKRLQNGKFALTTKIDKEKKQTKPITPEEKFAKMAEKNPAVKNLKDQLKLEFDY